MVLYQYVLEIIKFRYRDNTKTGTVVLFSIFTRNI
jgi:hypothetical protein